MPAATSKERDPWRSSSATLSRVALEHAAAALSVLTDLAKDLRRRQPNPHAATFLTPT